jgi:hypothetical protein
MKKYVLVFLLIFLITFVSAGLFQKQKTCGDGTIEGDCSINQPYFCSEQVLIAKASICGCSNLTEIDGDSCISPYQKNPKEISLEYVLRGEKGYISFTAYEDMANYLFDLPDFISYSAEEDSSRRDFKIRNINEENQRILLMPLVIKIQNLADNKIDQVRIAISLVQQIPFEGSNELIVLGNNSVNYSRYPYEVLYDEKGICASKSELMVFLLREIGYETVFFYHRSENHDSVGIKCPEEFGLLDTGYCFVETTGPSIMTDNENVYLEGVKLTSYPDIMGASDGDSLGSHMYEYRNSKTLKKIRKNIEQTGKVNLFRHIQYNRIKEKYELRIETLKYL